MKVLLKKRFSVLAMVALCIISSITTKQTHTYWGPVNGGIVFGPQGHSCGLELKGDFGPFCGQD